MQRLNELEHDQLDSDPTLFSAAENFVSKVVSEEVKLLRHRKAHASKRLTAEADSVWNSVKKKVHSLGKRIQFDNLKGSLDAERLSAQMLWLSSDARVSQQGVKHSNQEFLKAYEMNATVTFPSRLWNSFQMAESTWNAFVSSWLYVITISLSLFQLRSHPSTSQILGK